MRQNFDEQLNIFCDVKRATYTDDGAGGGTKSYTAVIADVRCQKKAFRDDKLGSDEELFEGGVSHFQEIRVAVPYDTLIRAQDQLVNFRDCDGNIIDTKTYEVTGINDESGLNFGLQIRAEVADVTS